MSLFPRLSSVTEFALINYLYFFGVEDSFGMIDLLTDSLKTSLLIELNESSLKIVRCIVQEGVVVLIFNFTKRIMK